MIYGSVCSGVEVASLAFERLGWEPAFFSEIKPFPRTVLQYRFRAVPAEKSRAAERGVPLWGDFTALRVRHMRRLGWRPIDLLIGGTPCQAFSFAGRRLSLSDARGNVTLAYVRLIHAIKSLRWVVWENVPGVLSTKDNAFGCFLGGLVGSDDPLPVPERVGRWPDAGMVAGPLGRAAWRVLDTQYFGLPQRRARVLLIFCPTGSRGDPAAILFERKGVPGDFATRGEARPGVARSLTASTGGVSAKEQQHTFVDGGGEPLNPLGEYLGNAEGNDELPSLTASNIGKQANNQMPMVAGTLLGSRQLASEDGSGRGLTLIPSFDWPPDLADPISASEGKTYTHEGKGNFRLHNVVPAGVVSGTLNANGRAAGSATQQDAHAGMLVPLAYSIMPQNSGKDYKARQVEVAQPLMAGGPVSGNQGGDFVVQAAPIAFDTTQITHPENRSNPQPGDPCHPLTSHGHAPTVAFALRGREDGAVPEVHGEGDTAGALRSAGGGSTRDYVAASGVRRLTVVECERLQGMPDNHTRIPWKRKSAEECPDGPRYEAVGNAFSETVIRWIGERIQAFEEGTL